MYDDMFVRDSREVIEVANVVFEKESFPVDMETFDSMESMSGLDIFSLLTSDDAIVKSSAQMSRESLERMDDVLEELSIRLLLAGALDGYATIEHRVARHSSGTAIAIISVVE